MFDSFRQMWLNIFVEKQKEQLGMSRGKARNRLVKDILFSLLKELNKLNCYRCNEELTLETLSIEHKIPWLDSENPSELYFNVDNISFSHLSCNVASARRPYRVPYNKDTWKHGTQTGYRIGCRCNLCKAEYSVKRKEHYARTKK